MLLVIMYVWVKLLELWVNNFVDFCVGLVESMGVVVVFGVGFGKVGEGYVRFVLVYRLEVLLRVVEKIFVFL